MDLATNAIGYRAVAILDDISRMSGPKCGWLESHGCKEHQSCIDADALRHAVANVGWLNLQPRPEVADGRRA